MSTTTNTKQQRTTYILIAAVILLLFTNIFTFFQIKETNDQLGISEGERLELQGDVQQLQADLDLASAQINEKDSALLATNEELQSKIDQINTMIRKGNIDKEKLKDYKNEIDQLRYYIKKYQDQIAELKQENQILTSENTVLKTSIKVEQSKSDELLNENITLNNKVTVAQLLKTQSISISPIRNRRNGDEKEDWKAKNIEKVKVCFVIVDNPIADHGGRTVYLRIINPKGNLEVITDQDDSKFYAEGTDMQYTAKMDITFSNEGKSNCMYWTKSSNYAPGEYTAILYADQVSIGRKTFKLD